MSTTTTTVNMNLIVPTAGQEPGPAYATDINADMGIIDQHDHSSGNGVQITPAGLNINTNLSLQTNYLTNVNGITMVANTSNTNLQSLYVKNGTESPSPIADLWYNDGAGNTVQITANGGVNATSASIPGESYAFGTFFWKQGAGSTTPANFDIGSVTIRPTVAATTFGVTLSPPTSISSAYTINLPALPSAPAFLTIDNSGAMTASTLLANGITAANIANNTITAAQIANNTITETQISPATITTASISATAGILGSQLDPAAGININQLTGGSITTSGSSGSASTTSSLAVFSAVTFSKSITRPIFVYFAGGTISAINTSGSPITVTFALTRGVATLFTTSMIIPANYTFIAPASSLNTIIAASGTSGTYNVTIATTNASCSVQMTNTFLNLVQV